MKRFIYKSKGAISVFLVLVLLPVLLFGGLTTDAARIQFSKVVISDAGEMTMNAALAQYNEELLDEYGMLVMDSDPESYEENLRNFFNKSLSSRYLPDSEDYNQLLDLVAEEVEAYAVQGSEIYRSEVERQQIVEYMKYRAPLCLVDMILEKLDAMKDTQKKVDAVKAQMEFSKSMKQCQDAIEEAYVALSYLEMGNEDFRGKYSNETDLFPLNYIQTNGLEAARTYYQTELIKSHLMIVAISNYEESDSRDLEDMARSFTNAAGVIDMDNAAGCFNKYLNCLYYRNGVAGAGGEDKIVDDWKAAHPEPAEEEPIPESERTPGSAETTRETSEHQQWEEELAEKEKIRDDYKAAANSINGYHNKLREDAKEIIDTYSGQLSLCSDRAESVDILAQNAMERLTALKPLIEDAQEKWQTWSDKETIAFENSEDRSADEFKDFFSPEDGGNYEELVRKVQNVQDFYTKLVPKLAEETFCDKILSEDTTNDQYTAQHQKAKDILRNVTIRSDFDPGSVIYTKPFTDAYHHVALSGSVPPWSEYPDDAFYKKLEGWKANAAEEDESAKSEANEKLSQASAAGAEAAQTDGVDYSEYNWGDIENADTVLPSHVLAAAQREGNASMTDVGGNVGDNEDTLNKFMASINAASSFLDGLDRIFADALEDLYVAEYTMQMFTFYTVDIKDGTRKNADDILSLSGYKMNSDNHKAYKAEAEYILWGKAKSQQNIQAVIMTLFGIRLLFNSIFAFTNTTIRLTASWMASAACGPAQFLVPIVKVIIQLAFAAIETGNDIRLLKQGYGVTIIKSADTWSTFPVPPVGDSTKGITLNYEEYMRIFLVLQMLVHGDKDILVRIADCIQVNSDYDVIKGYTMVSIYANVKSRTSFMRQISDIEGSGLWSYADDYYNIKYQSVLGY